MSEIRVLIMALLVWAGAWAGSQQMFAFEVSPLTLWVVGLAVGVAVLSGAQRTVILCLAVFAFVLGSNSANHFVPVQPGLFAGPVTLVTDPKPTLMGWQAEAKLPSGSRVLISTTFQTASSATDIESGSTLTVSGTVTPMTSSSWARSRHLLGRMSVEQITNLEQPAWYFQPSSWLRSAVRGGSERVWDHGQQLYLGLVIGDDRFQGAGQRATFRAVGLSHLLAVSGQNVAFVLAVVSPALRRLGVTQRLGITLFVLVVFAIATRLEPSVLRASVAAAIATTAVTLGRPSTGVRTLGLTVTVLLLVDPFLVYSVGFLLSVTASLGILILSPALQSGLPGPAVLRSALAVTIAAQIGVAPVLIVFFGPLSIISVPANAAVGWAAGLVMTFGLTIGVVAGLLPEPFASLVQLPSSVLVWWIDFVARSCVRWPAPRLGFVGCCAVAGAWFLWLWHRGQSGSGSQVARGVASLLIVIWAGSAIPRAPRQVSLLAAGALWIPASGPGTAPELGLGTPSVLVLQAGQDTRLLDELVEQHIVRIDVLVVESGSRQMSNLVSEIRTVASVGTVLAPPLHRVIGARRLTQDLDIVVGDGAILRLQLIDKGLTTSVLVTNG